MRTFFLTLLAASQLILAAGCVYVAPVSQGNLLDQEDVDQVEVGMTRNQVRFLLGTPMIDDPFHANRWDYVYYLKIGRQDATFKRWLSIHFENERVSQIVTDQELSDKMRDAGFAVGEVAGLLGDELFRAANLIGLGSRSAWGASGDLPRG